jgi:hypothetical protein
MSSRDGADEEIQTKQKAEQHKWHEFHHIMM